MQIGFVAMLLMTSVRVAPAAESKDNLFTATEKIALDKLVGQPVDLAPWAYVWRADLTVQETPEAYFIPRRLQRMDNVYRTAFYEIPEKLKSIHYNIPDLVKPLLPKPKGQLVAGLLWTGGLTEYQVELVSPAGRPASFIPPCVRPQRLRSECTRFSISTTA